MFLPFNSNAKRKHPTFIFSAIRSRLCLRRRFHHGFLLHICWEKFIHKENAATWEKSAGKKKISIFFFFPFCSCWGAPYIQDFTVRTRIGRRDILWIFIQNYEFWGKVLWILTIKCWEVCITNCFLRSQWNNLFCFVLFKIYWYNKISDITKQNSWSQGPRYTELPLYLHLHQEP